MGRALLMLFNHRAAAEPTNDDGFQTGEVRMNGRATSPTGSAIGPIPAGR
jgi:hypothetical protein